MSEKKVVKITNHVYQPKHEIVSKEEAIGPAEEPRLRALIDEIARTQGYLYSHRNGNQASYEERYADLALCLLMDGYTVENKRFQAIDHTTQDDARAV